MEDLPEEVVLVIVQYLTKEELLVCCAVSHGWREALNRDIVWRSMCNSKLAQYLRDTKCMVEPSFVSPEVADSGLSDLCEWRLNYMRQNHLYNNWRQGRYQIFQIPISHLEEFNGPTSKFYGCDFVVTNQIFFWEPNLGYCEAKMQLWNVTSKPISLSEYSFSSECLLKSQFHVYQNLLVLTRRDVVEVVNITTSLELKFKHAFLLSESEKITKPVMERLVYRPETLRTVLTVAVGPIFVALFNEPNQNDKLHVWNVDTGEKQREAVYEDFTFYRIYKIESTTECKIAVTAKNRASSDYTILIYDLTRLVFHPFTVSCDLFPVASAIHKEMFAIATYENLNIYNIETEQLVVHIPTTLYSCFCIFGNSLLFDNGHIIQQFKSNGSEVQLFFKHPKRGHHVSLFSVLCEKFIFVGTLNPQVTVEILTYFLEGKSPKVMRPLPYDHNSFKCINTFGTKLVISSDSKTLEVLHFW